MIVAVGTGTFFRILYSLNLVDIRPTLFIYCDWAGLDKNKNPFPKPWPKAYSTQLPLALRSPCKLRIAMEPNLSFMHIV